MKIILLKDVKKLGKKNDVVDVKDGYAKNYLIPNQLAIIANPRTLKHLQTILEDKSTRTQEKLVQLNLLKAEIEKLHLEFDLNYSHGKAFGHITIKQILHKLESEYKIKLNKHQFDSKQEFPLGENTLAIELDKGIVATLKFKINAKNI